MELQYFSLPGNESLSEKLSYHLEIPPGLLEERRFDDGEFKIRPLENVRNRTIFVIASLYHDSHQGLTERMIKLLFFISNLKENSAKIVIPVIPYFAFARKDQRSKPRDPLSFKYLVKLLESSGADRVITMDIHNKVAFENAFSIPTELIDGNSLFIPHILRLTQGEKIVIVSPDLGGIKKAASLQERLQKYHDSEIPLAFCYKTRSEGIIKTFHLSGNVLNRTAIIRDDILSTGRTLSHTIDLLKKSGAVKIIACITHALIHPATYELIEDFKSIHLLVSDSVPLPQAFLERMGNRISVIDSSDLFARVMKRVSGGDSIVELQEAYPELYLSKSLQA
jgi:ribose-phosphate pyrophosphokinase